MFKGRHKVLLASIVTTMFVLTGCSGDGGGDGAANGASTPATTQVSGKVTLSSVVSGGSVSFKAAQRAKRANQIRKEKARIASKTSNARSKAGRTAAVRGKVQAIKAFRKTRLDELAERIISRAPTEVLAANVYLFDADHPEWLAPVAEDSTDGEGYSLDLYMNAAENGDAYTDNAPIPSGNYTLVAVGKECSGTVLTSAEYPFPDPEDAYCDGDSYRYIVGVQAVVEKFAGAKEANLVVQRSDATPQVVAVMGEKLNALATNELGIYDLDDQALNNRVQVVFNMAMRRSKTPSAIKLKDANDVVVAGDWKMSADLTIATFYPAANLTTGTVYKVEIDNNKVTNYFGKGLANTVTVAYTTIAVDLLEPAITDGGKFPENKATVDISTYIMVEFDEPVDTNDMVVSATTKDALTGLAVNTAGDALGAKPAVKPMGNNRYQILPGVPLELGLIYDIELVGVKDLAGNEMTKQAAWNIVTSATSEGVLELTAEEKLDPAKVAQASAQTNVKRVIGGWVNAINNSDIGMFGSLLANDFTMQYQKSNTCSREGLQTCAFDTNKDGVLDYVEFISFIEGWFNENSQMEFTPADATTALTFTGDDDGIFILGDAQVREGESIDVDVASGSAAFKFNMTYHYGVDATAIVDGDGVDAEAREINLFLGLINLNGAWVINSIADRELAAVKDVATLLPITQVGPLTDLAEGTRDLDFVFTSLAAGSVSSYAILFYDRNDPSDETGWLTIVDATTANAAGDISVRYTQTADSDASDGQITLVGGGFDTPFERELGALSDGGRYSWTVIGFETLTAADFVVEGGLQRAPEGDMAAWSAPQEFAIDGSLVQGLTVTLEDSMGALAFSAEKGAWDAGSADSVTLSVVSENATDGKVFVSGVFYNESSFKFEDDGTATVTIPLYEGFNFIEVNVGSNWWFAAYPRNNSIYTTGGVQPQEMILSSVSADGADLIRSRYGEYVLPSTLTKAEVIISGTATAGSVLHFDINGQTAAGGPVFESRVVDVDANGDFVATLPVYKGFNWIGVWDDFGNWMDFGIDNQSQAVAEYVAPFSNVVVMDSAGVVADVCLAGSRKTLDIGTIDEKTVECYSDTYIVNTALDVTVSGVAGATNGGGRWWTNNFNFGTWFDGALDIDSSDGSFSFKISAFPGENMVGFEDSNFNMTEIIIVNTNTDVKAPHEITGVFVDSVEVMVSSYDWGETYYDVGGACSVTIMGFSSGSAGQMIYGDVFNNGNSEFIEVTAEADGSYAATVNVYGGNMLSETDPTVTNQGENWVNLNDARGIWQGTRILSTCADVPVGLELINVKGSDGVEYPETFDQYGGNFRDAGAANTTTLSGTAKAGAEIIVHVWGMDYRQKVITVLDDGTWSATVDLFNGDSWIDIEQGGNWRNTMVRTTGGLDCSQAPCSNQGFNLTSALFIDAPLNGETGLSSMMVSGYLDLAAFPLFGSEVIRANVNGYDGSSFVYSSDSTEATNLDGLIAFDTVTGKFSFDTIADASGTEIGVGVWGSVFDSPDFVEPIHGARIGVNGANLDGTTTAVDCGLYPTDPACSATAVDCTIYPDDLSCVDSAVLGANPSGSVDVVITSPLIGESGLGVGTIITGYMPPLAAGQIARIFVEDPAVQGPPMMLLSSDAADPLFASIGVTPPPAFIVATDGSFSITLDLDPNIKLLISMFVWADGVLVTGLDGFEEPGDPMYGYVVEVNAPLL